MSIDKISIKLGVFKTKKNPALPLGISIGNCRFRLMTKIAFKYDLLFSHSF